MQSRAQRALPSHLPRPLFNPRHQLTSNRIHQSARRATLAAATTTILYPSGAIFSFGAFVAYLRRWWAQTISGALQLPETSFQIFALKWRDNDASSRYVLSFVWRDLAARWSRRENNRHDADPDETRAPPQRFKILDAGGGPGMSVRGLLMKENRPASVTSATRGQDDDDGKQTLLPVPSAEDVEVELTIFDRSRAALEFCRGAFAELLNRGVLKLVEGDFTLSSSLNETLAQKAFDLILLKDVFTVIPAREARVEMIRRLVTEHLAPGGTIVMAIEDPSAYDSAVQVGLLRGTFYAVSETELVNGLAAEAKEAITRTVWFKEDAKWRIETTTNNIRDGDNKRKHIVAVVSCGVHVDT